MKRFKKGKPSIHAFPNPAINDVRIDVVNVSPGRYNFQLYMINADGTGLEQITTESVFNAFPMFSYDGKKLVFSSNRDNGGTRETNLFIADWVD